MRRKNCKIIELKLFSGDTPAPGAYNPVIQYKIKGYATQKAKRFPDDKIVSKTGPVNLKPVRAKYYVF